VKQERQDMEQPSSRDLEPLIKRPQPLLPRLARPHRGCEDQRHVLEVRRSNGEGAGNLVLNTAARSRHNFQTESVPSGRSSIPSHHD